MRQFDLILVSDGVFDNRREITVDGRKSGVSVPVESIMDMKALHGPNAAAVLIDQVVQSLDAAYNLTLAEKTSLLAMLNERL